MNPEIDLKKLEKFEKIYRERVRHCLTPAEQQAMESSLERLRVEGPISKEEIRKKMFSVSLKNIPNTVLHKLKMGTMMIGFLALFGLCGCSHVAETPCVLSNQAMQAINNLDARPNISDNERDFIYLATVGCRHAKSQTDVWPTPIEKNELVLFYGAATARYRWDGRLITVYAGER